MKLDRITQRRVANATAAALALLVLLSCVVCTLWFARLVALPR